MDQSAGDPAQSDSYEGYRFKVIWDGQYVAGVSQVGGLTQPSQVVSRITLEHGVTYDIAFQQWANQVWELGNPAQAGQQDALPDSRKDLIIEMYDETGQEVGTYTVYGCWVSEITSMPVDGAGNAVAIRSITLQHEGWDSA